MRHFIILVSFSFLLLACQEKVRPLSANKMIDALCDLHLAEAYGQIAPVDSNGYMIKRQDSIFTHYQYIFNQHKIDANVFREELVWYSAHPKEFEKIYDKVLSKLSTLKELKTKKENKTED